MHMRPNSLLTVGLGLLLAGCVQHIPIHPRLAVKSVPQADEPPVHPQDAWISRHCPVRRLDVG